MAKGAVKRIDQPEKISQCLQAEKVDLQQRIVEERLSYSGRLKGMHSYGASTATNLENLITSLRKKRHR